MNYYTAWVTATIIGEPKKKPHSIEDLEDLLTMEVINPDSLDMAMGYFNPSTRSDPPHVAAAWVEKTCKVELLIKNIEDNNISNIQEYVIDLLNANRTSSKLKDIEITKIEKQKDFI